MISSPSKTTSSSITIWKTARTFSILCQLHSMLLAFVSYLPVIDKDSSKLWLSKAEKDNDFISVFFHKRPITAISLATVSLKHIQNTYFSRKQFLNDKENVEFLSVFISHSICFLFPRFPLDCSLSDKKK